MDWSDNTQHEFEMLLQELPIDFDLLVEIPNIAQKMGREVDEIEQKLIQLGSDLIATGEVDAKKMSERTRISSVYWYRGIQYRNTMNKLNIENPNNVEIAHVGNTVEFRKYLSRTSNQYVVLDWYYLVGQ